MQHIFRRMSYLQKRINRGLKLTEAENDWMRRATPLLWRCYNRNPL